MLKIRSADESQSDWSAEALTAGECHFHRLLPCFPLDARWELNPREWIRTGRHKRHSDLRNWTEERQENLVKQLKWREFPRWGKVKHGQAWKPGWERFTEGCGRRVEGVLRAVIIAGHQELKTDSFSRKNVWELQKRHVNMSADLSWNSQSVNTSSTCFLSSCPSPMASCVGRSDAQTYGKVLKLRSLRH